MKKFKHLILPLFIFQFCSAQNIGIGTTTPNSPLTVRTNVSSAIGISQTDGVDTIGLWTNNVFGWVGTLSNHPFRIGAYNKTNQMTFLTNGNVGIGTTTPSALLELAGQIKITGGTPGTNKVLTSDANGLASWQTPASGSGGASAGFAAHQIIGGTTQTFTAGATFVNVKFKTKEFDDASAFNTATSQFTAPSAGLYHFDVSLTFGSTSANTNITLELYAGSSAIDYSQTFSMGTTAYNHASFGTNIKLAANETVEVLLTNLSNTSSISITSFDFENRFSGYKVY